MLVCLLASLLPGISLEAQTSFGSVNVGASASTTVTFQFAASETLTGVLVLTQGASGLDFTDLGTGSCTAGSFSSGQTCTVNVKFAPLAPGLRSGAVELVNSGNLVMTAFISGIGAGPQVVFSSGVQSTVGTGLDLPVAAIVDAAGNVFIGDAGGKVITVPAGGGAQTSISVGSVQGLAIDGEGNLYFSIDTLQGVIEIPRGCASASCTFTLAGGLGSVAGALAVDATGAVYAAEYHDNRVVKIPAGCTGSGCIVDIADSTASLGGLNNPLGVAVDGAGNLYIADSGNNRVLKVPAGCASSSCQTTLVSVVSPGVLAVDAAGDLYITHINLLELPAGSSTLVEIPGIDAFNSVALDSAGNLYSANASAKHVSKLDRADAPTLDFGSEAFATASAAQSVTVANIGNASLTFSGLALSPADYQQQASGGTDCSSGGTLLFAAACNLEVVFTPASIGSISGSATFTDNALNVEGAQQVVHFGGTGTQAGTTVALVSSANPAAAGLGVSFTATVSVTTGSGVPGGTVTFQDNGNTIGTRTLSNGVTTLDTSSLAPGEHPIMATYSGAADFSASASSPVNQLIVKDATTTTISSPSNTAFLGAPVTLTAAVSTTGSGKPSGTINFEDNATIVGTGTLDNTGHTTLVISTLALGLHSITAVYSGDSVSAASTSAALSYTIDPPTVITIVPTSGSVTLPSGQSTTDVITLTGNGTFTGPVVVSCTTQTISCQVPSTASLSLTPSMITLTISAANNSAGVVASYQVWKRSSNSSSESGSPLAMVMPQSRQDGTLALSLGLFFAVLLTLGRNERSAGRRRRGILLGMIGPLLVFMLSVAGCGGGGTQTGGNTKGGGGSQGVPAGNYSVTVTVASGNVTGKSVVNVAVQ
jgi:hypothetical protein